MVWIYICVCVGAHTCTCTNAFTRPRHLSFGLELIILKTESPKKCLNPTGTAGHPTTGI